MHRYSHTGDGSDTYFVCGYFGILGFSSLAAGMSTLNDTAPSVEMNADLSGLLLPDSDCDDGSRFKESQRGCCFQGPTIDSQQHRVYEYVLHST
jgi:hypothetical protein